MQRIFLVMLAAIPLIACSDMQSAFVPRGDGAMRIAELGHVTFIIAYAAGLFLLYRLR